MALIGPAKQHPEVVVEAVAEEDGQRVEAFARRHGIGRWFSSCQGIDLELTSYLLAAFLLY